MIKKISDFSLINYAVRFRKEIVSSLPDSQEILPYTPLALMK